ncbi:aspartyl-tRNA synthetase [Fusarium oxysporum f. sp. lycopersici 4287]|uniref:Probable aspartate--tRNA ligase, cytoplasmic n=2 Tax=Fusarium oxysporum TaxID=5507 RepID=A0A0J9WVG1_FUSO4|nr:aspartyl-tRNA synthetase [Fusarium oxysporum f. sp. lycopersici 4287]XP_018257517.1 aspartyl-tRNA synthetase [Fusarium oxysporum f. sp. lycopersici 4287]KAJ9413155.1 aspartyl-tRNA synthetase [Fusarium oxysporum]KNB19387.1 aspartyl-tRNA synthetase [Fusarium oxysporum f. sp. lycopersici 4287]KNB19472.1 aspartyl-tRNA synthetase [Fusarium oxysporum f. sp. lycopersici 4287]
MHDSGVQIHSHSARSNMDDTLSTRDAASGSSCTSLESGRTSMSADWPVHPGEINTISQLDSLPIGTEATFRARIETQRPLSKVLDFLLLRDQTYSVQGVLARDADNTDFVKWVRKISPESLVQVCGVLKQPPEPIRSATHSGIEVDICSVHLVNSAQNLPFSNYKPPETLRNRMSSRILDLRHPSNQALFRLRSLVSRAFRNTLEEHGFVEIHTPKLQPAATESGAAVFPVSYFDRRAFLAQSPQLAKQMSISADFGRVFEVGPVFRAENSNTHRHLTEYTGLDLEMAINTDYHEVIQLIDIFLKEVFKAVYSSREIEVIRKRWPSSEFRWLDETPIIPFREGIKMLREDGRDVEEEDLSTPNEIRLGQLVREKYGTDYYVLDKFPANARPFYAAKDPEDPKWTRSFDIFIRGQEICSGGQRIHNAEELRANMVAAGMSEDGMEDYLIAFDLGVPPHAGAGLGLERIVSWMLELGDVRYASLFHRDPKSLPTKAPGMPHPEADTTKLHQADDLPPLEKLIANYGDATNTSWLDERFQIWRHETGAAVGWVQQQKFAMITGDPLCDRNQYQEVIRAFIKHVTVELRLTPIWMLVSFEVQKILASELRWRSLSCIEEQRVDNDKHNSAQVSGLAAKARRVEREGVKIHEVKLDDDFIARADPAIEEWKAARKGKQVHLTEVRPWVDQEHRRYFAAGKDGKVVSLVVLAKLAPRHGWQVKWALDFPGAVNGSIEVLISHALSNVTGQITFGAGVSERLTPGEHVRGLRARFLAATYRSIVDSLGLRRKSTFRSKFGALGEEIYICYPKHGVTLRDLQQIVKFFQD